MADIEIYFLIAAIWIDALWGEYPNFCHPVAWLGHLLSIIYALLYHLSSSKQLMYGWILALMIPLTGSYACWFLIKSITNPWLYGLVYIFLLKSTFALKALGDAHMEVFRNIASGDIPKAQANLSHLCSRTPHHLDEQELMGASISSIAENLCDSIVAPCFFYLIAGLPGAAFYRIVNTADAMFGYKDQRLWLGQGAAKLDDLMNYIPARITALLLILIALFKKLPAVNGLRIALRDSKKTPSPNGGWPMATMAGLLNIRLSKPGAYELGDPLQIINTDHMRVSWSIVQLAGYLTLTLALLRGTWQ